MDNSSKTILHLCADIGSDTWPYRDAGYNVILVGKDIGVENYTPPKNVYGIIANPPCTNFSYAKTTGNPRDMREGMRLVKHCLRIIWECQYDLDKPLGKKTKLKFWALENPYGLLRFFLGIPALEYSPWEYGDNYKKKTNLWGNFNIPKKEIGAYKTDSHKLPKWDHRPNADISPKHIGRYDRKTRRSIVSEKFAEAFFRVNQ